MLQSIPKGKVQRKSTLYKVNLCVMCRYNCLQIQNNKIVNMAEVEAKISTSSEYFVTPLAKITA